jgi:hypothetical protein
MQRKETVDIVEDLVNGINLTFTATDIIDLTGGFYQLNTTNTLHLQVCNFLLTIDGETYIITEVVKDSYIVLSGAVLPTSLSFDVYAPFYFHGTILATKSETDLITDSVDKTPMIFLLETIIDEFKNQESRTERTSSIRMFFLTQSDWEDNNTNDHYTKAIEPMRNLVYNFIDSLKGSKIINKFVELEYTVINHTHFAEYVKGSYNNAIFDANLTGCELLLTLEILKNTKCNK